MADKTLSSPPPVLPPLRWSVSLPLQSLVLPPLQSPVPPLFLSQLLQEASQSSHLLYQHYGFRFVCSVAMISTAVSPAIAIAVSAIVAAVVAASKASESSHYFRSVFSFELPLDGERTKDL
ncbi:uncharacterized protein [Arachis hypogaea]|uniref:uncharacterized protein n=1 Tax=Arachis hypogaea TaxID=3818 RepID=UPI000DEDB30A|nr:uncharacterized protein LOC112767451 [Arachis hypogaea]